MMPEKFVDFLEMVNDRLDAEAVVRLLAFHPEGISVLGNTLKAYCPAHKGGGFKSLQVDLTTRRCRCVVRGCPASQTLDLVEFFALCAGLPPLAGALRLAHEFGIEPAPALAEQILGTTKSAFPEALGRGDLSRAEELLAIASEIRPAPAEITEWRAMLAGKRDGPAAAAAVWIDAAEARAMADAPAEACAIVEALLGKDPENVELLAHLSRYQRQQFRRSPAWGETLFRRARILLAAGREEEAREDMAAALEVCGRLPPLRAEVGRLHLRLGDKTAAIKELWTAAFLFESEGQEEEALPILEELITLDPLDVQSREKVAEIRAHLGDLDSYLAQMERLCQLALERGEGEAAELYARRILSRQRENPVAHETLALLAEKRGETASAAGHLLSAGRSRGERGERDAAIAHLEKARELGPEGTDNLAGLAAALHQFGRPQQAVDLLATTVESLLDLDLPEEARQVLLAFADLGPSSAHIVPLLKTFHRAADTASLLPILARLLDAHLRENRTEEAAAVLEAFAADAADHPGFLELRLRLALSGHGDRDDALESLLKREEDALAREQPAEALELLRLGRQCLPGNPVLLEHHARLAFAQALREEALSVWRELLTLSGLGDERRLELGAQAASLSGGGPSFKLLLGLAQWKSGRNAEACDLYTDLAEDLLQEREAEPTSPALKQDPGALDDYLDFLGHLLAEEAHDLAHRLEGAMASVLGRKWSRFSRLCATVANHGGREREFELVTRFLAEAQAAERWDDALQAIAHLEDVQPENNRWKESRAHILAVQGELREAAEVWCGLIASARRNKGLDEAVRLARRAGEEAPGDPDLGRLRLEVLLQAEEMEEAVSLAGPLLEQLRAAGRREEAITVGRTILLAAPRLGPVRLRLAEDLLDAGELKEARSQLRHVGEEACGDDPALARRAFGKLLEIDPHAEDVLVRLVELTAAQDGPEAARPLRGRLFELYAGELRSGTGDRDDLLDDLYGLIRQDAEDWALWKALIALLRDLREAEPLAAALVDYSEALMAAGRLDDSLAPLEEAVGVLPGSLRSLTAHAQRLEQLGRLEEAAAAWERQIALAGSLGETPEAMLGWSRLARLRPGQPRILCDYAHFLDEAGETDEALRLYHQAVELYIQREEQGECVPILERMQALDPSNLGTRGQLADALAAGGEEERALAVRLSLAEALVAKGDYRWAGTVALQARQESPDSHEARALLARVYLHQGRVGPCISELADLLPLMIEDGRREEGLRLLEGLLEQLMIRKEFNAVLTLLDRLSGLTSASVGMLHHQALAHEGAGRDQEAAEAWINLAGLVTGEGDHARAERCLRRAIALLPQEKHIRLLLTDAIGRQGGREAELVEEYHDLAQLALNAGERAEAADFLRRVLAVEPGDLMALRRLAPLLAEIGRNAEAVSVYLDLGRAAIEFDDPRLAGSAFSQACTLDPLDPSPLSALMELALRVGDQQAHTRHGLALATLHMQTGNREQALALYETIAREDPSDRESRRRLAGHFLSIGYAQGAMPLLREIYHLEHDAGEFARAIETLQRIEEIDPADPETLRLLGQLHLEIRDITPAAEYLLQSARNHRARGNVPSAVQVTERLLEVDPWNEESLRLHLALLEEMGRTAEARKTAERLLEIATREQDPEKERDALLALLRHDPRDLELCGRLAHLYSDLDRNEEAAACFLDLSELHEEEGNPAAALDAADTASTLVPDCPRARERLARLYLQAGNPSRAAEQFAWLAGHYEETGEPRKALSALKSSPSFEESGALRLRAAQLLEALEEPNEAVQLYQSIAEGPEKDLHPAALHGVIRADPHNVEAFSRLDALLREAGKWKEAEEAAIRVFGNLLSRGEIDTARDIERRALEAARRRTDFLEHSATLYEEHGLPELAAASLREVAALLETDRPEDALRLVDHALELKPWDSTAKELRFRLLEHLELNDRIEAAGGDLIAVYLSRSDTSSARGIARRMIRLQPEEPSHRVRLLELLEQDEDPAERMALLGELTDLYLRREETEEALDCLRAILRLDPDDVAMRRRYIDLYRQIGPETDLVADYLRLARALGQQGETLEASKIYEKILEMDPSNGEVQREFIDFLLNASQVARAVSQSLSFASQLLEGGRGREALAALEAVAGGAGEDPAYHLALGRAHLTLNARGAGVRELRQAAHLFHEAGAHVEEADALARVCREDPFNLEARQLLVEAHLAAGQQGEAIAASLALAATCSERGLPDLALAEFRRAVSLDPENMEGWNGLFATSQNLDVEEGLLDDFLRFADLVAGRGDAATAVEYYRRAMNLDPTNLRAHRGFVMQYPKVGSQREIVEELLTLSQLLVEAGELDEAIRYFELVMSIDPRNTRARDMLSATRSRAEKVTPPADHQPSPFAAKAAEQGTPSHEQRLTDTQKRFIRQSSAGPEALLQSEIREGPQKTPPPEDALEQVVANYRNILAVNAGNAEVRLKLAEVLGQMGRESEMLQEMLVAAEAFYNKSDLEKCIGVCNEILERKSADPRARRLLNEAEIKRDAISALDSTISFIKLDTDGKARRRQNQ